MARSDINLDGSETTVVKALGMHGSEVQGSELLGRVQSMDGNALISVLHGLMEMGYVEADNESFYDVDGMSKAHFHVNPGYAKVLREAIDPEPESKSKRTRRE